MKSDDMKKDVKHVALLIPDLGGGGAEHVTANLANGLAGHGIKCDLLLIDARGCFLKILDGRIRVVDLKSKKAAKSVVPIVKYLRSERPDLIISALDRANIAALMAVKLSMTGTKIAVAVHITHSQAEKNVSFRRTYFVMRTLIRLLYPFADSIVAVSKGAAQDLSGWAGIPEDRIRVIYNPIIEESMLRKAAEPPGHPWLERKQGRVVVGIGRLTQAKNYGALIRAFSTAHKRVPDSRLIIVGDGEERGSLERLVKDLGIEDVVSFNGFAPNPYAFMRCADLLVLSSLWEALPTVLIEALAVGVPIVSVDCESGPREILRGGELGRLVRQGDVGALAEAVADSLEKGRSAAVSKEDWKQFTVEAGVRGYVELVESLIGEKKQGAGCAS